MKKKEGAGVWDDLRRSNLTARILPNSLEFKKGLF